MKKPIAIIFNDTHLKVGNEQEIIDSVQNLLSYANTHNITDLIFAGDLFDSRSHQRQSVLASFLKILDLIKNHECKLHIIPGNHDKTDYASKESFLDAFQHHPCIILYREMTDVLIEGNSFTFLPFFNDDLLIPMLTKNNGTDVLISHFEMAGSTNLGMVSKKTTINKELLEKWNKVYLGHYHNHHKISKDIVHLPSLMQASFGEDSNKGFSVFYNDLSYKIIKGNFKEFKKILININTTENSEILKLIELHKNKKDSIRFEFFGDESKLKLINRKQFNGTEIDVKIKYESNDIFNKDNVPVIVLERYNETQIKEIFKEFCEEKNYNHKNGLKILQEFLKRKQI